MRKLGPEDLKHIGNLIKGLQRTEFEKVKGPEILSLAFAFQWLGELKAMVEEDLKPLPPPVVPLVVTQEESSKKRKK